MTLQEFFLRQKQAVRARSREIFALLRPQHMDWKPEKNALSASEMLRHLWTSEEGVRRCALEGDFTYFDIRIPQGLAAVMGSPGSLEDELKHIERAHQDTLTQIAGAPAALFDEERANPAIGYRRKVAVILFGMNEHEVHHRAQLMTYLRMLGTPAPEPFARPKTPAR